MASPATALANSVFPVPGAPTNSAPLGIFPPSFVNFFGFFKNSTISFTSSLASSSAATSLKVNFSLLYLSNNEAFDFPILKICPPGPPPVDILLNKNQNPIKIKIVNPHVCKNE